MVPTVESAILFQNDKHESDFRYLMVENLLYPIVENAIVHNLNYRVMVMVNCPLQAMVDVENPIVHNMNYRVMVMVMVDVELHIAQQSERHFYCIVPMILRFVLCQ